MTESSQHTSKPQVEVEASGGDDNKSARRGAIFIGVVLVGYIVYLVVTGQMGQFWAAMSSVQASWLVVACLCMFLYLFFGIVAYAIAVWLDPNSPVGIRDLISVEASGIFFGNLTPMMMGSTPAQIYRLTKAGQNVGEAGATQFTRFIVYQFGLVAWGAILLLARMPFFAERYGDMTLLCVFSFGGHCCILLGIFAVALMPKTVTRVAHCIINWLERIGVSATKIESWRTLVDGEIYSFSEKFKLSAGHFSSMLLTVVITMLQLAFFYLVPYFLMLAFWPPRGRLFLGHGRQCLCSAAELRCARCPVAPVAPRAVSRCSWAISLDRPRLLAICCGVSSRLSRRPFWPRLCWGLRALTTRASTHAGIV